MKPRLSTVAWIMMFGVGALALYLVKYQAQDVKRDVVSLRYELQQERESIRLLQAEWAYLNRPDRLRTLASRYLKLSPYDATRLSSLTSVPMRQSTLATPIGFDATTRALLKEAGQH